MEVYLHPSIIHIKGKIAIPDLQRGCLIVDEVRADDVILGDYSLPGNVSFVYSRWLYIYLSMRPATRAGSPRYKIFKPRMLTDEHVHDTT